MKKAQGHNQLWFDFSPGSRHRYEILDRDFDLEEALENASGLHGPVPKSWAVKQTPARFAIETTLPGWVTAPSGNPYAKDSDALSEIAALPILEIPLRELRPKPHRIRAREIREFCGPFYHNIDKNDRARLRNWIRMAVEEINNSDELVERVAQRIVKPLVPIRRPADELPAQNRPQIEEVIEFLRKVLHVKV